MDIYMQTPEVTRELTFNLRYNKLHKILAHCHLPKRDKNIMKSVNNKKTAKPCN